MQILYNLIIQFVSLLLPITKYFSSKMNFFVEGRKDTFKILEKIASSDQIIWIHCASLGEFEQGRPIIENIKTQFPNYKILLSFFSPSGFEIRKNYDKADFVVYLPIDTKKNAEKFIAMSHPVLAIFVKYEFWWNHLNVLKKQNITTLLISGIFRENQLFFKSFTGWYRSQLQVFSHFFVQDENSKNLLQKIGYYNITISGDTRFDRVQTIKNNSKEIPHFKSFCDEQLTIVFGSSWLQDLEVYIDFINKHHEYKYIIAPHNIHLTEIEKHKKKINQPSLLQSQLTNENVKDFQVVIMDTMGWLSSAYAYADIAYIGGGFGQGIHNLLEAATYGIPIIFGPNHQKFKEANDLIELGAGISIKNKSEFEGNILYLLQNQNIRKEKGEVSKQYILNNIGATQKILGYIKDVL